MIGRSFQTTKIVLDALKQPEMHSMAIPDELKREQVEVEEDPADPETAAKYECEYYLEEQYDDGPTKTDEDEDFVPSKFVFCLA